MTTKAKAKTPKRASYCRFCGANKGHATSSCQNSREMRAIIQDQDDQLKNAAFRQKELEQARAQASQLEANNAFMSRLIHSLLDLCEAHRAGIGAKV